MRNLIVNNVIIVEEKYQRKVVVVAVRPSLIAQETVKETTGQPTKMIVSRRQLAQNQNFRKDLR